MKYKCQLYISNDLFKVVEFDSFRLEIPIALPPVMKASVIVDSNPPLQQVQLSPRLLFTFSGVVAEFPNVRIARYDFVGVKQEEKVKP